MKRFFLFSLSFSIIAFFFILFFARETFMYNAALHCAILSLALFLIWKDDLGSTLASIGFPGEIKRTILFTGGGFMAIIAFAMVLNLASMVLNFNDQAKVSEKIGDLPLYVLALAVIGAPITEELLFRAALVPRFGIIAPALAFGIVHLAYGSVVEVVGVAAIGIILGFIYDKSKSITPCIIIHLVYNLLSIIAMRMLT